jgi:hypothetical protein
VKGSRPCVAHRCASLRRITPPSVRQWATTDERRQLNSTRRHRSPGTLPASFYESFLRPSADAPTSLWGTTTLGGTRVQASPGFPASWHFRPRHRHLRRSRRDLRPSPRRSANRGRPPMQRTDRPRGRSELVGAAEGDGQATDRSSMARPSLPRSEAHTRTWSFVGGRHATCSGLPSADSNGRPRRDCERRASTQRRRDPRWLPADSRFHTATHVLAAREAGRPAKPRWRRHHLRGALRPGARAGFVPAEASRQVVAMPSLQVLATQRPLPEGQSSWRRSSVGQVRSTQGPSLPCASSRAWIAGRSTAVAAMRSLDRPTQRR